MQARMTRPKRHNLLHAPLHSLNILQQPSLPSIETVAARILHVVLIFVLFKVSPRQVFGVINNYKH